MEYKNEDFDKKKIAEVSGTTALTAVKNTIPTVNDIYVKIKRKNIYISLTCYNKITKNILDPKIKNLI